MKTVKGPDSKEERIAQLIEAHQLSLLRLCTMYLHDEESAKDAVQETFIKAYMGLDDFRGEASEKTWLTRIAINTCKNMKRSGWFRHVDRSVSPEMLAEQAGPDHLGEMELTIELMKLPKKLKEVALLCWLQGSTCEEAAEVLGISRQAAGSRLDRARKKLRKALEGGDEHDHA